MNQGKVLRVIILIIGQETNAKISNTNSNSSINDNNKINTKRKRKRKKKTKEKLNNKKEVGMRLFLCLGVGRVSASWEERNNCGLGFAGGQRWRYDS